MKVYSMIFPMTKLRYRKFQWLCKRYTVIKQQRKNLIVGVLLPSLLLCECADQESRDKYLS